MQPFSLKKNRFQNTVCKMSAILVLPQCVRLKVYPMLWLNVLLYQVLICWYNFKSIFFKENMESCRVPPSNLFLQGYYQWWYINHDAADVCSVVLEYGGGGGAWNVEYQELVWLPNIYIELDIFIFHSFAVLPYVFEPSVPSTMFDTL